MAETAPADDRRRPPSTDPAQWRYTGVIYLVTAACHAALSAYALSLGAPALAIAMGLVAALSSLAGALFLARSPYAGALATGVARCWDGTAILCVLIIAVASLWTRALSQPTSVLFVVLLLAGCGACANNATTNAAQALGTRHY